MSLAEMPTASPVQTRLPTTPSHPGRGVVPANSFRFRMFPLGILTGLFDPDALVETIRAGCADGYRLVRREFSIEKRRVLFFLAALGFGLIFRRTNASPEPEHDWRVAIYKTRFFTRTVDTRAMELQLNDAAQGGFEFHFGVKFPTRFLFFFPRESYVFVLRRPFAGTRREHTYRVDQVPYRFFTRTIDAASYEAKLNDLGMRGQLKITFRDERRLFGLFRQPTVITVSEEARG